MHVVTDSDRVFLEPAEYVDSDHPQILAQAARLCAGLTTEGFLDKVDENLKKAMA